MAGAVHNHPQDGLNLNPTITAEVAMEMLSQARVREVQLEAAVRQLLQQNEQAANTQLQLIEQINKLEAELNPEMHVGADEVVSISGDMTEGDTYDLPAEA